MTQPPQNNNPYPVPGPNGEPVQPAANGYQAPVSNGFPGHIAPGPGGYGQYPVPGQMNPGFNQYPNYATDQLGHGPIGGAAPAIKRLNLVLLLTAVAYLIAKVLDWVTVYFVVNLYGTEVFEGFIPTLAGTVLNLVVGVVFFFLVWDRMNKGEKIWRVVGFVFAGLGMVSALLMTVNALPDFWYVSVFSILWFIGGLTWIIMASQRSVRQALR